MSVSANARPPQPRHSAALFSALRCLAKSRYGSSWTRTLIGHHQIPRLDGDQAERCDANLPFASRLIALLSMTPLGAQAFAEGEIPFSGRWPNGGFRSRKVENALSFNGD
jgi:hypothetical protein